MKAVNLLPSEHRGAAKAAPAAKAPSPTGGSAAGAYAVLGALALAIVMVVAYVLVDNSVKDRRAELARVNSEAELVRAQADALKPYGDFRTLAAQRVTTVKQIAQSRFDWERALRDISRALPVAVHLKSMTGSVSNSIGVGGSAVRSGVIAPAIELAGCTSSQTAVATLMARLKSVRGVTRVSLQKSEKADQLTTSTGGQGPLCGRGNPPSFEVVMFFERAATAPTINPVPGQAAPADGTQPAGSQPAQDGQPAATPTPSPASGSTSQGVSTP